MKTSLFEGRKLTEEEIELLKFFEHRRQENKIIKEKRIQQQLQLAQLGSAVPVTSQRSLIEPAEEKKLKNTTSGLEKATPTRSMDEDPVELVVTKKPRLGSTIDFSAPGLLLSERWSAAEEKARHGAQKEFLLPDFGFDRCQTLAFEITVPKNSKRWSINIGPGSNAGAKGSWENILLHFNPRRDKKKSRYHLLTNDMKATRWGLIENVIIEEDLLFNRTFELIIQILPDGFFVAIDGHFCSIFAHRSSMAGNSALTLQIPIENDYGDPEDAIFEKIWWGMHSVLPSFLDPSIVEKISRAAKDSERTRTCFVTGLPKHEDENTVLEISDLLLDLFEAYSPVDVHIIPGKGQAYIKVASEALAADAIKALNLAEIRMDEGGETIVINVDYSRMINY